MKHTYLSETVINEALSKHVITEVEAEKLKKKIDFQKIIYKATHK